jgi:hypothetical protein
VEAKHGRSAKDWWPAGHLLPPLFLSPPLSTSLAQPPHLWAKVDGQWPHGLAAQPPLGSPIKGLTRGASSFILQAHKQSQIFGILLQVLSLLKLV